ncbi:MAG: HD domain-containing protein [Candidatus Gracilibacteria bacterium]|nr:HD domain-containing protein [Candidatus Gracilibacteria bacterium]
MEKIVVELYENLVQEILKYNPYYDEDLIQKAFLFANEVHKNEFRASKEPYITHCINTALKLTKLEADDVSIACALLHEVLDNTKINSGEIELKFGKEISNILKGVKSLGEIYYTTDMTQKDIENLKSQIVKAGDDIRIFLVKIADRYHNLETLNYLPKEKRYRIAKETQEVYIPIVNFLSIGEFISDMYDYCFKYTNQKEYNKLKKEFGKDYNIYQKKILNINSVVELELNRYGINFLKIEGRVKTLSSIFKKLQIKKLEITQIYDVLALRIITKEISDCYLVLGVIHKIFKIKNNRFKDYVSSPKENGYQSIHTTVYDLNGDFIEFQIQTEDMYKLNKTGLAAHFIYKGFGVDYSRLPKWMIETLDIQKKTLDSKKFLEKLNQEVFISEIKVFDTLGNRTILPKGAVLIDFAFKLGIDFGKFFNGAYVNGVFINDPFYILQSGDFINIKKGTEVFTGYKVDNFFQIKTKKARENMKVIFGKYSKLKLIELGKYLLNNSLEIHGLRHFSYQPKIIKNKILNIYGLKKEDQFYVFLGIGSLDYKDVSKKILELNKNKVNKIDFYLKIFNKNKDYLNIKNILDIIYNLNIDLGKINYTKDKNSILINIKLENNQKILDVIDELKRTPNVLRVFRVFPTRLKIYYFLFTIFILSLILLTFYLNLFFLILEENKYLIDFVLFILVFSYIFMIFFLKYIVKKMLPDILKYRRFYVSLIILNSGLFFILIYNILISGINIPLFFYIMLVLGIYSRLYFNYSNLKNI